VQAKFNSYGFMVKTNKPYVTSLRSLGKRQGCVSASRSYLGLEIQNTKYD
jgi:hypothetical protein